jgi:hypothetical protein
VIYTYKKWQQSPEAKENHYMDYYNNQPKSHKTSVASVRPRRQHDVHQSHAKSPDMGTSPVLAQGHDGSPDVYYGINDGPDDNTNLPGGATTATL